MNNITLATAIAVVIVFAALYTVAKEQEENQFRQDIMSIVNAGPAQKCTE